MSGPYHSDAIRSPAYRIHVQNVDISGCNQKVLKEGSDHMPRFELPFSQLPFRRDVGGIAYKD
jgi:hypothetical protein